VSTVILWFMVGFVGQALYSARFLVQWIASERKHESVVPIAFWWLSLLGGTALLAYAIFRRDPVIVIGQGLGLFVYTRNLILVDKSSRRLKAADAGQEKLGGEDGEGASVPTRDRTAQLEGRTEGVSFSGQPRGSTINSTGRERLQARGPRGASGQVRCRERA
jgi:lipid-A-disaccharide synthase-like uncharacterized protein